MAIASPSEIFLFTGLEFFLKNGLIMKIDIHNKAFRIVNKLSTWNNSPQISVQISRVRLKPHMHQATKRVSIFLFNPP